MSELEQYIYEIVEAWVPEVDWDSEECVSSEIASTNSIFHFDVCEDIEIVAQEGAQYKFEATFQLYGEPRKDDVPFCGDKINIYVEGQVVFNPTTKEWEIDDEYDVSAWVADWRGEEDEFDDSSMPPIKTGEEIATDIIQQLSSAPTGIWYRGHADTTWKLDPTIARETSPSISLEKQLADEFERKIAYLDGVRYPLSKSELYFLMQHHGLPTRLLDWTSSPLVALYFAVQNPKHDNVDGCIWRLDPSQLNRVYGLTELVEIDDDLFDPARTPKVTAIRAHHTNVRMNAQKAEFTVHRDYAPIEDDHAHTSALQKSLDIPRRAKKELRTKLLALGTDRATIFPDLDNIAQTVRENVLGN